jgi:hypothetical protein
MLQKLDVSSLDGEWEWEWEWEWERGGEGGTYSVGSPSPVIEVTSY